LRSKTELLLELRTWREQQAEVPLQTAAGAKTERPSGLSDGLFGSGGTNEHSSVANSHANSCPAAPALWRPYFWEWGNQRTQQCGQQSREQLPCSPSIMETLLLGVGEPTNTAVWPTVTRTVALQPQHYGDLTFGSGGTNEHSSVANSHVNSCPAAPALWRPYFWEWGNQRTQQCGQQSREQLPCRPSIMETLLLGSPL